MLRPAASVWRYSSPSPRPEGSAGTGSGNCAAALSSGSLVDGLSRISKASDPERWAKEVAIHKELADQKAAAIVEEERRKGEARIREVDGRARSFVDEAA
jgi:hypothetical protein